MKTWAWIFLLFLLFTGCTKFGKNISISGYVRNPVSGQYYADVKIKLMRTDGGLPGGYKDVKVVYTNADGYFELDHFGGYSNYYLGVDLTQDVHILGWFEDGEHVGDGRMNVDKGRSMQPVLEILEYGELITNIQNINCEGPTDQMQFRIKSQFENDFGPWSSIREGCYSYTSPSPIEVIPGYREYELKITRMSGSTTMNFSVFVPSSGSAQVNLFY